LTAQRNRLVGGALLVAAAVGAAAYGFLGRSGSDRSSVVPRRPGALAVGPKGVLYISDTARNQILARLPDGSFHVVAGTGRRGFSGDGGPAVDAALDGPGGMAVGRGGTLYVADQGNNRVRTVSRNGIIRTVAELGSPTAVTIGPDGGVYVAAGGANEVVRLAEDGTPTIVAGIGNAGPAGVFGIGRPATEASADGPFGLAFDVAGDLFIGGFNTKDLLMVGPDGTMRLPNGLHNFYPRGNGGLVATARGVVAINGQRIVRLTPQGVRTVVDFRGQRLGGVTGFQPNGIADAGRGALYVDTYEGNGFANASALVEVGPGGHIRLLWRS
jgi:hypothetical protein